MNVSSVRDAMHRAWRTCAKCGLAAVACVCLCQAAAMLLASAAWARTAPALSVAFFYAANPPFDDLKAFDIAVVEPDHVPDPKPHRRDVAVGASELFACVSFGGVEQSRAYFKSIPPGFLKGENQA